MWPSPDFCQHGRVVFQLFEMPSASFCHFVLLVSSCGERVGSLPMTTVAHESDILADALSLAVTQLREQVIPCWANARAKESSRVSKNQSELAGGQGSD